MKEREFILKIHRRVGTGVGIYLFGGIISFTLLATLTSPDGPTELLITLFIISVLINLSVFIYSFYFGWNNAIYFNNEKVWRKIKGKRYEWYWEDMESCDIYYEYLFFRRPSLMVEITAKSNCEKLKFELNHCKKLIEICPNETVREEFKKAVEKFHIRLWW